MKRHRSVVTDAEGRIWFSLDRGISMVDPARLTRTSAPAIAHVQASDTDTPDFDLATLVTLAVVLSLTSIGVDLTTFALFTGALGLASGWGYSGPSPTCSAGSFCC